MTDDPTPTAEVSYDLIMLDHMHFAEGTFRLPGGAWQVFIFSRSKRYTEMIVDTGVSWESGVVGMNVHLPQSAPLNKAVIIRVLTEHYGCREWAEVRGPDSMNLR